MAHLHPSEEIYQSLISTYDLATRIGTNSTQQKKDSEIYNTVYGPASVNKNNHSSGSDLYILSNSIQSSLDKIVSRDFKNAYRYYWDEQSSVFPVAAWKKYRSFSSEELLTILECCKTEHLPNILKDIFSYSQYDGTKHLTHILFNYSSVLPVLKSHDLTFKDFVSLALEEFFYEMKSSFVTLDLVDNQSSIVNLTKKGLKEAMFVSLMTKWIDISINNISNNNNNWHNIIEKNQVNQFWDNKLIKEDKNVWFNFSTLYLLDEKIEQYMKLGYKDHFIHQYIEYCLETSSKESVHQNLQNRETLEKIKNALPHYQHSFLNNNLTNKEKSSKMKI